MCEKMIDGKTQFATKAQIDGLAHALNMKCDNCKWSFSEYNSTRCKNPNLYSIEELFWCPTSDWYCKDWEPKK